LSVEGSGLGSGIEFVGRGRVRLRSGIEFVAGRRVRLGLANGSVGGRRVWLWSTNGFTVGGDHAAHNRLLGALRRERGRQRAFEAGGAPFAEEGGDEPVSAALAGDVRDELLRMLFVCCDEAIPRESRLVLALKTLCGFSAGESAARLFTTEANVYKRLARARERLRERRGRDEVPAPAEAPERLGAALATTHLVFIEGDWRRSKMSGPSNRNVTAKATTAPCPTSKPLLEQVLARRRRRTTC
jgi:hypothetical protein